MKKVLKNKCLIAVVAFLGIFFGSLVTFNEAKAYDYYSSQWYDCVNSSGGREDIDSVGWACWKTRPWDGSYGCAIWLGSSTDTLTYIYVDAGTATVTGSFYRMCTSGHADAASNVYAYNDGGSIGRAGYVSGGYWGSPGRTNVSINVAKFKSGAQSWTSGDYTYYYRNIGINRCNATNPSSCDQQDADIYLVERDVKKTLRMKAIDTNGNSLSSYMPDKTVTVSSGSYASLTAANLSGYNYIKTYWGTSTYSSSWWSNTSLTYGEYLSSDKTIYAVYKLDQKTLTMKAVDTNGNSLSHLMADKSTTVVNGQWASLTANTLTGYTKKYWGTSATGGRTSNTDMTYGKYLYANETVWAVYERHEFAARARVFEGEGTSGSNKKDTGYTEDSSTQTLNLDCLNSGCKVTFDIYGKNVVGSAAMNYTVYRSQNGGSGVQQYTNPAAPSAMSSSGQVIKIYNNGDYRNYVTETILPGQTICYYVVFYPFGTKSNTTTSTVKSCAHANPSTFQGLSKVGSTSSGWTNSNSNTTHNIEGCTAAGCNIKFQHYLKRTAGIGSTAYTVTRTSNYSTINGGTLKNETETFNGVTNGTGKLEFEETLTLKPGQVICETLTFKPSNDVVNVASNVSIKMCASALGNAQPDDPTDPDTMDDNQYSNAFLDMRVKNPSGPTKYQKYQKNVYAKPGQKLYYRSTYNPTLQYTYYIYAQKFRLNGTGTIIPTSGINTTSTLGALYNANKGSTNRDWNNAYSDRSEPNGFATDWFANHRYTAGETDKRVNTNTHDVVVSEVGRNLAEKALTNMNVTTRTTPGQVTFTSDGSKNNVANVYVAEKSSTANAYIPYNYDSELKIKEDPGDNNIIYAGEDKVIKYEIDVKTKKNTETTDGSEEEAYATIMPDVISKVVIYLGTEKAKNDNWGSGRTDDVCKYFIGAVNNGTTCKFANEKTETLNPNGNTQGSEHNLELNMKVPDVAAGTQLCVAVASFPSSSGANTNWNSKDGSGKWRISKSRCFTIAKKPMFEVWGGSLYAGKSVNVSVTSKNNLRGFGDLNGVIVFSSWVEQSATSTGSIFGLASGAATGLAAVTTNNPAGGGSYEGSSASYCNNRVPLSLSNFSTSAASLICNSTQSTGHSGISAVITNKQAMVETLPNEDNQPYNYTTDATISLNNSGSKDIIRYNIGDPSDKNDKTNVTINTSIANTGKTHIIRATGNVTINGNITYQTATYDSLEKIPKVIIYGNDITIGCNVDTISAILIAEGDLSTCESGDINAQANSRRLTINGAIITNNLYLNRTYGAATGVNSKVPAEIVNYDISTLLWGRAKSDPNNEHKNLQAVYAHEIAPRY